MLKEINESDTATFAFQAFDWLRRGKSRRTDVSSGPLNEECYC